MKDSAPPSGLYAVYSAQEVYPPRSHCHSQNRGHLGPVLTLSLSLFFTFYLSLYSHAPFKDRVTF